MSIIGVTSVTKLLAGQNIHPGGTEGDVITDTCDFLKDVDTHMIKLLTVEVTGDNPEQITFHIILGSNVPPILGTQYTSLQHKMYTTSAVTNREYIENKHITQGHIQIKPLKTMSLREGKWQPSFSNIIEDVIEKCTSCQPKHVLSSKPHSTPPKAMDFNKNISVDLKELHPEYRKDGYKYIIYIIDKFSEYMKGVLIKDKEAETVVTAVCRHWVIGVNGLGFGAPTKHVYSDNSTEFISDISEEFSKLLGLEWKYTASHSPHSNGFCERNH